MGKISFSHKIEESFNECFEKLYQELGPPKYRILEACIEAFVVLPRDIQYRLKGFNANDRDFCLNLLTKIGIVNEQEEPIEEQITHQPTTLRQALCNVVERTKAEQQSKGKTISIYPEDERMLKELTKLIGPETKKQTKKRKRG